MCLHVQCSSQDYFFIERGKKTGGKRPVGGGGGGGYIVMVHCFSQSVCFFIIKPGQARNCGSNAQSVE